MHTMTLYYMGSMATSGGTAERAHTIFVIIPRPCHSLLLLDCPSDLLGG